MLCFKFREHLWGIAVEERVVCGMDVGAREGGCEVAQGIEFERAAAEFVSQIGGDAHGVAWRVVPAEDSEWGGAGEQCAEVVGVDADAVDGPVQDG